MAQSSKKNPHRQHLPYIRSTEQEQALRQYEETIRLAQRDSIDEDLALYGIYTERLYQPGTYEAYGLRFGYKKSTLFHKKQFAQIYLQVRNCASFPPTTEYQLRQLAALANSTQQQAVWQRAVTRSGGNGVVSHSILQEEIATEQNVATDATTLTLIPDHLFRGIAARLEIGIFQKNPDTGRLSFELPGLPEIRRPLKQQPEVTEQTVTVIVSPDIDLAETAITSEYWLRLIEVMATMPNHRFLIWSRRPEWNLTLGTPASWPVNIDFALRVESQADLQRLHQQRFRDAIPLTTLWLAPTEPLTFPSDSRITRVLMGVPSWSISTSALDPLACRQAVHDILTWYPPCQVHLTAAITDLLYQVPIQSEASKARPQSELDQYLDLIPDTQYCGIDYRWVLHTEEYNPQTNSDTRHRVDLAKYHGKALCLPHTSLGETRNLVLVSPDYDCFTQENADAFLGELLKRIAVAHEYRFILWSRVLEPFAKIPNALYPNNVEVAIQLDNQGRLDHILQLRNQLTQADRITTIWISPPSVLAHEGLLRFQRDIASGMSIHISRETRQQYASAIGKLIGQHIPVHLSQDVLLLFAQGKQ